MSFADGSMASGECFVMSSELRPLSGAKLSKKALVTAVRDDTEPALARHKKRFRGGPK